MARIILASQSPRRQQLLRQVGLKQFDILVTKTDERASGGLPPEELVSAICREKALAARAMAGDEGAVIITADTMVFLDGQQLGKPRSEEEAFAMLSALSGREHLVCTGVSVGRGQRLETEAETTAVRFAPLSRQQILDYIATGEPMDKAGAYGIQGRAALFVTGIRGDYYNVMGLPLYRLGQMLDRFGVSIAGREEEA